MTRSCFPPPTTPTHTHTHPPHHTTQPPCCVCVCVCVVSRYDRRLTKSTHGRSQHLKKDLLTRTLLGGGWGEAEFSLKRALVPTQHNPALKPCVLPEYSLFKKAQPNHDKFIGALSHTPSPLTPTFSKKTRTTISENDDPRITLLP